MVRLSAALAAFAALLSGQSPTPEQTAQVFAIFQHTDTPGCTVGIQTGGQTSFGAYGMADLEHAVSNTQNTVFEAGSVSKQFTAAAVLLLVERGQVSLDDDIRKYFPEIPEYQRPITVRHLLNHTSGLRDWGGVEYIAGWPRGTREYTHALVLEIISRQRALNYAPGDAWSYTNSGYNLAAMLVERVSGTTLQAFCRKEFFDPLGMTSTQWRDDFRRIVPNRAIAYSKRGADWRQDMPFEDIYGNGGLLTTVGDLLKWNRNLADGKLHPALFAQMQKPSVLNNGDSVSYGFGFFLEDFEGLAEVSHSGATAGYRTWLGRIPGKDLSVAVLCNAGSANAPSYAHQLVRLYLGLPNAAPNVAAKDFKPGLYRSVRDRATINIDQQTIQDLRARFEGDKLFLANSTYGEDVWEHMERWTPANAGEFTGTYASDEAEIAFHIALENGTLVMHRHPDASFPLKPTYPDAFESDLGSVHFLRDATGKVSSFALGSSRVWDLRFRRQAE